MIRHSSYGGTNSWTSKLLSDQDALQTAYRELIELRGRVQQAEAAAARRRVHRPLDPVLAQRRVAEEAPPAYCAASLARSPA
jgi:hypothetical protein